MSRSPDDPARSDAPPAAPDGGAGFDLRGLPEWVKGLGLPPEAVAAIDRYWAPAWDAIADQLALLPVHPARAPEVAPAEAVPAGAEWLTFEAVAEDRPGPKWRAMFEEMWPAYRCWYLQEGEAARPDLATCRRMLERHMPELVATHERLTELAGGDDLAARFLSGWCPPAFIAGCSQAALTGGPRRVLVRNYDYPASRLEGVVVRTAWTGRRVIGMSDCLWGLLDGLNDAGLAVSLTFGGRKAAGEGFGIPVVVRYLLETCETVEQARAALARLPVHAPQNLTLLDRAGDAVTVYVGPDRRPEFRDVPATTNHQGRVDWPEYARAIRSVEREQRLLELLAEPGITAERLADAFLDPPLYSTSHAGGFGTIYTAAHFPDEGRVQYRWPGVVWDQSFEHFKERTHVQAFTDGEVAQWHP
jgi:predicted choloylglycine hydrolase